MRVRYRIKASAPASMISILLLLLAAATSDVVHAQDPKDRTGGPSASAPGAEVYFVDLKDGATVPSKLTIHFGLRNMGVGPAGLDRQHTGHHHLLIDTDLPPLDQPIPNDFNHLHYGAGQTEAEITLSPGEHTLQLLLGDKDHIPHTPPVMSARIRVKVADAAPAPAAAGTGGPTPSAPGAEVYFVDLKDGAVVPSKTTVKFGLRNMEVAPAGAHREHSGHHHLLIDTDLPPLDQPIPSDFNHLHYGAGQTEAEITLSPGEHTLQLLLGDKDHIPHTPPVMSPRIRVKVADAAPAPPPARAGGPTASAPGAEVYFVDLKDGATVPAKTTVRFGLRNMEVAPAGAHREHSGHHHLLIDTDLPALDQPIPNDFNHLHYGAGQTEAEIALAPGEHTLQLLLGDKDHIPHSPPVMSPRIRVSVGQAPVVRKPSPPGARVYFVGLRDWSVLPAAATIRFGLVNMGVAPAGSEKAHTGHHHLLIDTPVPPLDQPIPSDFNHLHFGAGQTEAQVNLPLGTHTIQLLLADENHVPHDPPVMSKPLKVVVTKTGKRRR
jgi:hypothetical protein